MNEERRYTRKPEPVDDLVAFLRARLDEDEQAARRAHSIQSTAVAGWKVLQVDRRIPGGRLTPVRTWAVFAGMRELHIADTSEISDSVAVHIARHDPARVLAEVDAKRRIVDAYRTARQRKTADWRNYSRWANGEAERNYPVLTSDAQGREKDLPGLELALRLLAMAYAAHPDYREEWRP